MRLEAQLVEASLAAEVTGELSAASAAYSGGHGSDEDTGLWEGIRQ
jgi:hypothetical protein